MVTSLLRRLHTRRSRIVAVDLGTACTRIAVVGEGLRLDEPTLIAYDRDGEPQAAGRAAWDMAVSGPGRLCYPVRHSRVVDPTAAVQMLQLQFRQATVGEVTTVVVGVPAGASPAASAELTAIAAAAAGAPAVAVAAQLAAALGAGLDINGGRPQLVVDIGAGATQVAAVSDSRVPLQERTLFGVAHYADEPVVAVAALRGAVLRLLDAMPERRAADVAAGPLWLVGGGALLPALRSQVSAALGMSVQPARNPRTALVRGLAEHVVWPSRAQVPA